MVCMEYLKTALSARSLHVPQQESGTIKKFSVDKGFCFTTPDVGSTDVFAHVWDNPHLYGCIQGDSVKYDTLWDDRKRKYMAINISVSGGGEGGGGGGGGGGGKGDGRKGKDKHRHS